jgi:hypothetical protein
VCTADVLSRHQLQQVVIHFPFIIKKVALTLGVIQSTGLPLVPKVSARICVRAAHLDLSRDVYHASNAIKKFVIGARHSLKSNGLIVKA